MYFEVITTITSKVPVTDEGFGSPSHAVDVDGGDLGEASAEAAMAVVIGGLNATKKAIQKDYPRLFGRGQDEECPFDCDVCHREG